MGNCVRVVASLLSIGIGASEPSVRAATEADVGKLRKELQDQRQLLVAILKAEQKRNEMLLRYLLMNEAPPSGDGELGLPGLSEPSGGLVEEGPKTPHRAPPPTTATLRGTVALKGQASSEAYVYVENVVGPPVSASLQIKQENKQFSPRVAVVQRGTRLIFSNADSIFHNVFSTSPGYAFDLGAQRAGDAPKTVVAGTPGVIEIYCNMHSRMSSTVLVVPSGLYAKVDRDGSFQLNNVPVGSRKIVAWAPGAKAAKNEVEVRPGGGEVRLSLEVAPPAPHLNKFGQPFDSYE